MVVENQESLDKTVISMPSEDGGSGAGEAPPEEEGGKPAPTPEEIAAWDKDARYEKVWGKDPNKMYGAYKGLEKVFTPTTQVFKKYGIKDAKHLEQLAEAYLKYTDPKSEQNQVLTYIGGLMQNEVLAPKVRKFFDELNAEAEREKFGKTLPPEVIEKLKKAEAAEAKANSLEERLEVQDVIKEINTSLVDVQAYADKNNLVFDQTEFLEYCKKRDIQPKYMLGEFLKVAQPAIEKKMSERLEGKITSNLAKNKKAGIITGGKPAAPAKPDKPSFGDSIRNVLKRE